MSTYLKSHTNDDALSSENTNQEIMQMLINGALSKIKEAKLAHENDQLTLKGFHLGRATNIIDAIRNTLDTANGDQTIKDIDTIYERVDLCLQAAVEPSFIEYLDEALDIMENITIGCNWVPLETQNNTQGIRAV